MPKSRGLPRKMEIVTPIEKVLYPKQISDLRKIGNTSDYSKLFESFLKDWILDDIKYKIDPSQFGGRKGSGTEHLIVCFVDRVLKLLDSTIFKSAVISASCDWSNAFDRLDPTKTAQKLIQIGIRSSIVPVIISYMSNRKMIVKYKNCLSKPKDLIGGGTQGTLLGGIEYIVASDDCSKNDTKEENRYKYYDDLNIIEFVILTQLLTQYNFHEHVPSDVGIDEMLLPPENYQLQRN